MSEWVYTGPNPITSFAVGVEFLAPIQSAKLQMIAALHPGVKKDLPRKTEQPSFVLQFPGAPLLQAPGRPGMPFHSQIGGVAFDRIKEDGTILTSLSANGNVVTYMTQSYSRWEEFQPVCERLVFLFAEQVITENNVSAVILSATNTFSWLSRDTPTDLTLLLNRASHYLPSNMLAGHQFCHNFHGFLTTVEAPRASSYVRNINVNTGINQESEKTATIIFTHRLAFNQPVHDGQTFFVNSGRSSSLFRECCDYVHNENNLLFADVVNSSLSMKIPGLKNYVK